MQSYFNSKNIDTLTQSIIGLAPSLTHFFESQFTIEEYSKQLLTYSPPEHYIQRQKIFKEIIKHKIDFLFSDDEQADMQLEYWLGEHLKAGVADHHGILNHPDLFGMNIVTHYARLFDRQTHGDFISFATGNIPLDDHFHDRGFQAEGKTIRLFSNKHRNEIIYGHAIYDFAIEAFLQKVGTWHRQSPAVQKQLQEVDALIKTIDFSTCTTLGDQFTKINYYLWPLLFNHKIRDKVMRFIPLEYEELTAMYLIQMIENKEDTYITRMLFDELYRTKTIEYFDGVFTAWNSEKKTGTHFFWGLDADNKHVQLHVSGNQLTNQDGTFTIDLTPEAIVDGLRSKKLVTAMFIKYTTLLFYLGIKPFAGYGSAHYLSILKDAFANFLASDYPAEAVEIQKLFMANVTSLPVIMQHTERNTIESYYAFDIIRNGGLSKEYFKKLNTLPVKHFIIPALNLLYDYLFEKYGTGTKEKVAISPNDYVDIFKTIV